MGWRRAVSIGSFVADSDGEDFRATMSNVGWEDAAPIRSSVEDKSQQDGSWDAVGFYGSRVINHTGEVERSSRALALAVVDELRSLSPGTLHEYTVDDPNIGVRSATVRVVQGAAVEWRSPVRFQYTMQLRASDPLLYGPAWFGSTTMAGTSGGAGFQWPLSWPWDWGVPDGVTPGSLFVPNDGLAPYWTKLRIDGPVPNPVVGCVETGDSIRWDATLGAGQWLDIDTGERHVTFGANQDDVRAIAQASGLWLVVPPGGATFTFDGDTADPAAKLSVFGYEGAWD